MALTNSSMTPLQRFFGLLKPDRQEIFSIYIYAIFSGLVNLSLPLGIQAIVQFVSGGQASNSWIILIVLVILGIGFSGLLQIMQLNIVENLQRKIFTRAAFSLAYRIPQMKIELFEKNYPPEIINRFFDTLNIQKGLSKLLIDFPTASLQIIFSFILLSFYHPFFIVFSFLLVLLLFLIFLFTGPRGLATSLTESKYKYEVAYWLQEVARTMETFKLAGKTELPLKKTDKAVQGYLNSRKSHFTILIIQYINLVGFKMVVSGTLLVLGGILVMDQRLNIGQFVAAEILIVLMLNSVEKLILSLENIYDVLTAVEKLGSVMDLPLDEEKGISLSDQEVNQGLDIQLRNVSINFGTRNKLTDINMKVKAGQKVCIMGESGAGKTVLLQLIAGLYPNFNGALSFNNIPFGNLNINFVRDTIGDSLAKEDIFRGSVLENITVGKENLSLEIVKQAVEIVGLTDYIATMKEGYDTILQPHGRTLPAHVVTKIVLARCIVGSPSIMLIDEGIESLPEKDKVGILQNLLSKSNPSTVIIASNSLTLASQYDIFIILKDGKIAFQGNYSDWKIYTNNGIK